jgi:hypothetical protein
MFRAETQRRKETKLFRAKHAKDAKKEILFFSLRPCRALREIFFFS